MLVAFCGRFLKRMKEGQKGFEKASNFALSLHLGFCSPGSLSEGKDPVDRVWRLLCLMRGAVFFPVEVASFVSPHIPRCISSLMLNCCHLRSPMTPTNI